jgi:hypothetical protein
MKGVPEAAREYNAQVVTICSRACAVSQAPPGAL